MGFFNNDKEKDSLDGLMQESDKDVIGITCKNRLLRLNGDKVEKIAFEDCKIDNPKGKGFIKVKRINVF